jgi:hypothetical protein
LDRDEPILLSRPYRVFEYFNDASPAIIEGLILPLYGESGDAVGTMWIVSHEEGRGFDQGILETMTRLADFTALALRMAESTTEKDRLLRSAQREIADRKRAEDQLDERQERLAAELDATRQLQEISTELVHERGSEALYEKLIDAAISIMRSDFASMQMLHPERGTAGELRLLAFRGFNQEAAKFWEWVRADSESTCGAALRTGRRVMASNVETCDFMAGTDDQ